MTLQSKADLHIHSTFSDGQDSPQKIVAMAVEKKLSVIAITDHNRIAGAKIAKKYAKERKLPLQVIIGEEIYTQDGEIIGLFLKNQVTPHQTAQETCRQIKKQGGLVIAPHPASIVGGTGLSYKLIKHLIKEHLLDAVELHNGGDLVRLDRHLTKYKSNLPSIANIGGSDAHQKETIGLCYTLFPRQTAQDLKRAIEKKLTQSKQATDFKSPPYILNYFLNVFIRFFKKKTIYSPKTPLSFKIRVILKQIIHKYWQT